ncbi:MAG: DUF4058 family protein [Planctomycetes bacterium]|nr:DUF4058 family protein [Planctomycetota bacterium]
MASPFPGMDPYLEDPGGWLNFHNSFGPYLADDLNAILGDRYIAFLTERVIVETPAAEFYETGIEIRHRRGNRVVTVIELMSPTNKARAGPGREQYLTKQSEVLSSDVNLVEIDLLRAGEWTVGCPEATARTAGDFDYLVSASRPESRLEFEIFPIPLDRKLPRITIPLADGDPDVVADLQSLLDRCYDRGRYAETIDYSVDPVPPLPPRWSGWARELLRASRKIETG